MSFNNLKACRMQASLGKLTLSLLSGRMQASLPCLYCQVWKLVMTQVHLVMKMRLQHFYLWMMCLAACKKQTLTYRLSVNQIGNDDCCQTENYGCRLFNPLAINGFFHPYHLDESTFIFSGTRSIFLFLSHFSMKFL